MRLNLAGFIASVGFIGIGSEAISVKNPYVSILGVATAGIATAAAITTLENMLDEVYVDNKSIFERITDGLNNANAAMLTKTATENNRIEFISGRLKTVNVANEATNVHSGLSNSANLQMKLFFWAYKTLDNFVTDINKLIEWGNENVPLFEYSLIDFEEIATKSQEKNYLMESDDFENYSFTISDSRISIEKVDFGGNGKINFQLKIPDDVKVDTIVTKLNYKYDGFFNTHGGSVDIRIIREKQMSLLEKLAAWGPWKSQVIDREADNGGSYAVFYFYGEGADSFNVTWYNAVTDTPYDSEKLCYYYVNPRFYVDDDCNITSENYQQFEIISIVKIEEGELILNDDGFSWVCTPLK